jgi:hypothetical protein
LESNDGDLTINVMLNIPDDATGRPRMPDRQYCRAKVENPFTLLPIISRLSCCLKLALFEVLNLDRAKTKNNRERLNMGTEEHYGNF